jgi:hypothetical protein
VKDFARDLGRWLDDEMTQALLRGLALWMLAETLWDLHRRLSVVEEQLEPER